MIVLGDSLRAVASLSAATRVTFFVAMGAFGEGVVRVLSLASLPVLATAVLCSAAAVYEAWQRE